jgi:hypothetical protein
MSHFKRNFMLLPALFSAGAALADATHVDAELSLRRDNNVSRAEASADIQPDTIAGLDVNASRSMMLNANSGLLWRGGLKLAEYSRFDDLSHLDLSVGATYRIQPVAAYTAPWFELGVGAERQQFMGSSIRDGNVLTLDLGMGKRFTDRLRGRVGAGWERRYADDNEVFDWQRLKMQVTADFKLTPAVVVYGNASRAYGDQVFTATPAPAFRTAAKAIVDDTAFGARRAYRLNAVADVLELGGSFSLNSHNTLDVGYRYFQIDADGGHSYDGSEIRASWLYRFQ